MYRPSNDEEKYMLGLCVEFMSDTIEFSRYMLEVSERWVNSMQHNLTNTSKNRKSFLGQCACCYAIDCPEKITKKAWKMLTQDQREKANEAAQKVVENWVLIHTEELETM